MGRNSMKMNGNNNIKNNENGEHTTSTSTDGSSTENLTTDSVYEFYKDNLFPAIASSFPLLLNKVGMDAYDILRIWCNKILIFLIPGWLQQQDQLDHQSQQWNFSTTPGGKLVTMFENAIKSSSSYTANKTESFSDFMLTHLDTNNDGVISPKELFHMDEFFSAIVQKTASEDSSNNDGNLSWLTWFNRTWPLMDWKIGVFLWRTCGGLLLVIIVLSIIPGRLHGLTGRLLRWPILALTYCLIGVELVVYVIIRLFIKLVEFVFANSKHRKLRHTMRNAKSYEEWYQTARQLDISQGRNKWQKTIVDDTSYRYNWTFIKELMSDLKSARKSNDSLMALAVLQQCTRKSVGGIMCEEQFTYTNTGEPKHIVEEFINEVVTTLRWVTDEAKNIPATIATNGNTKQSDNQQRGGDYVLQGQHLLSPQQTAYVTEAEKQAYERKLHRKVKEEKNKIFSSLISWATLSFGGDESSCGTNDISSTKELDFSPSTFQEKQKEMRVHSDGAIKSLKNSKTKNTNGSGSSSSISSPRSTDTPEGTNLPPFHREAVISFLRRARALYGRTALCLSGGAMMGNYHWGHIKALMEEDCLPHIMSGTSAGSVIGAFVCCRTDEEIRRDMKPEILEKKLVCFSRPWPERIRSVLNNGHLFDGNEWYDLLQWFTCGSMTFEEAYKKSGRILCITLSATTKTAPPVLLNYISAPNVVISSAICASAAVPGFIPPVSLKIKKDGVVRNFAVKDQTYWDGSIDQDIPTSGLAEMLNCHFFLAAQCNPHIVPFFYNSKGAVGRPSRWSSGQRDASWRGGFLLSALELYLKGDMKAKCTFLHDLEVAVGFTSSLFTQKFEGTTTIVPQVSFVDYFELFSNPTYKSLKRYFQAGSVAAYQHTSMIKLHYQVAHALDECLTALEQRHFGSQLLKMKSLREIDGQKIGRSLSLPPTEFINKYNDNSENEQSTVSSDEDYELYPAPFTRQRSFT